VYHFISLLCSWSCHSVCCAYIFSNPKTGLGLFLVPHGLITLKRQEQPLPKYYTAAVEYPCPGIPTMRSAARQGPAIITRAQPQRAQKRRIEPTTTNLPHLALHLKPHPVHNPGHRTQRRCRALVKPNDVAEHGMKQGGITAEPNNKTGQLCLVFSFF